MIQCVGISLSGKRFPNGAVLYLVNGAAVSRDEYYAVSRDYSRVQLEDMKKQRAQVKVTI